MSNQKVADDKQTLEDSNFQDLSVNHKQYKQSKLSVHLQQYQLFFGDLVSPSKTKLLSLLKQSLISYDSNKQGTNFLTISLQKQTKNYQIVRIKVQYGPFSLYLLALNNDYVSSTHQLSCASGSYGSVYFVEQTKQNWCVKCISFSQTSFKKQFTQTIKQISLLKIASALNIGPHIDSSLFGFDLVIYYDCIQFAMQQCIPLQQIELCQSSIKLNLMILHSLMIVHMDIKPQNMAVKKTTGEPVFLDFGLSELLKNPLGNTTDTFYAGTANYGSKQMIELGLKQQGGLIDLYFNDMCCMETSIAQIYNKRKFYKISQISQIDQIFQHKTTTYQKQRLISYIFQGKYELLNCFAKVILVKHRELILKFIANQYFRQLSQPLKQLYFQSDYVNREKNVRFSYEQLKDFPVFSVKETKNIEVQKQSQMMNAVPQKFDDFRYGLILYNEPIKNKIIISELSSFQKLTSKTKINELDSEQYYFKVSEFIDLTSAHASFDQKKLVASIFLQTQSSTSVCIQHQNPISDCTELELCSKTLYLFHIQSINKYSLQVLPTLFLNLIILQSLSEQEILNYFFILNNLPITAEQYFSMWIRSFGVFCWIDCRINSKYVSERLFKQINQTMKPKLDHLPDDQNHHKKIIKLFLNYQEQIKIFQQMPVSLYYQIMQLRQKKSSGNQVYFHLYDALYMVFVLRHSRLQKGSNFTHESSLTLKYLVLIDQKISFFHDKIYFFHIQFFHDIKNKSKQQYIAALKQKFRMCLGNQQLFKKYLVYWYTIIKQFQDISWIRQRINLEDQNDILYNAQLVWFIYQNFKQLQFKGRLQLIQQFKSTVGMHFKAQKINSIHQTIFNVKNIYCIIYLYYYLNPDRCQQQNRIQRIRPAINKMDIVSKQILPSIFNKKPLIHILFARGFYLQKIGYIQLAIQLYLEYINLSDSGDNNLVQFGGIQNLLEQICYLFSKHPSLTQKFQIQQLLYKEIVLKQKEQYLLITSQRVLTCTLFGSIVKDRHKFMYLQQRLCLLLKNKPIKNYFRKYQQYLFRLYITVNKFEDKNLVQQYYAIASPEFVRNFMFSNSKNNPYLSIFASVFIRFLPDHYKNTLQGMHILLINLDNLNRVGITARTMIKNNTYFYLRSYHQYRYQQRVNLCLNQHTKRLKRLKQYHYRQYVRHCLIEESPQEFIKKMAKNKINQKILSNHQNKLISALERSLRVYYLKLNIYKKYISQQSL